MGQVDETGRSGASIDQSADDAESIGPVVTYDPSALVSAHEEYCVSQATLEAWAAFAEATSDQWAALSGRGIVEPNEAEQAQPLQLMAPPPEVVHPHNPPPDIPEPLPTPPPVSQIINSPFDDDDDDDTPIQETLRRAREAKKVAAGGMDVDRDPRPPPPPPPPPPHSPSPPPTPPPAARPLKRHEKLTISRIASERKAAKEKRMYQNVLRARPDGVDHRRHWHNEKPKRRRPVVQVRDLMKEARPAFKGLWEWVCLIHIPTSSHSTESDYRRYGAVYGGKHPEEEELAAHRMTLRVASTIEDLGWNEIADVDFMVVSPPNSETPDIIWNQLANFTSI